MAKRTGVPALIGVALELCRLITKFSPVIVATYPSATALHAALAAANAACSVLHVELSEVREYGD